MRHVFFDRSNPRAGVLAAGFEGTRDPRVRDRWHRACRVAEGAGLLDAPMAAALAMRAAEHYGVGEVVEQALGEQIGGGNAGAAAQAAEEGWGDWAWRRAGETADDAKAGVRTVYADVREGVRTVYTDTRAGGDRLLQIPEQIAATPGAPERWLDKLKATLAELKGPLTAGAVGLTLLGGLYLWRRK